MIAELRETNENQERRLLTLEHRLEETDKLLKAANHRTLVAEANVENMHKILNRVYPGWFYPLQTTGGTIEQQSSGHR